MQKKPDTIEKVQRAADELLARGQRPTQQAVRDLIGTGSITTINKALNIWWSNLSKRINRQTEHPTLPDPVITAASKLWDQALAYSHVLLEKQQAQQNKQIVDREKVEQHNSQQLQERLFSVAQQNNRLLEGNEKLLTQQQSYTQKIYELESLLIQKNAESSESARLVKQQQILLDKQTTSIPEDQVQVFFQAKIDLKVNERVIADLKTALLKSELSAELSQQKLLDLEKTSIKQIHRLELVIAQQDTKYNNVREELASFQARGR